MTDPAVLEPTAAYALWAASYPAHAHNPLMQAEERAMLALLPATLAGRNILDAGCGSGRYLRHARARGARRALGVDLSRAMLERAAREQHERGEHCPLLQASLDALPLRDQWADLALCGLTIGHLPHLRGALAELRRVTRIGGTLLCSDFHPIGHALGWRREFQSGDQTYAVRHTAHLYSDWQHTCTALGLRIVRLAEPFLDPQDIPAGARFDPVALQVPVALAIELVRER